MRNVLILTVFLLLPATLFASPCPEPRTIRDLVACQNLVVKEAGAASSARISRYMSYLNESASLACTRSGASAQPAYPMEGDLRCFFVFSNTTASFNIVDGTNDNDIEVSQTFDENDIRGVLLGRFDLKRAVTTQEVLTSGIENIPGTHMSCQSCHRAVSPAMVQVEGVSTLVLKPVKINATLSGSLPRHGQVRPEDLDRVLKDLSERHKCSISPESETCLRIEALMAAPKRLPLDEGV